MTRYATVRNTRPGRCQGCTTALAMGEGVAVRLVAGTPWALLCGTCYRVRIHGQEVLV
jgi:RNase P subunit RPR2